MLLPRRRHFGFSGCPSYAFFPYRAAGGFDCFSNGFFFDPFFLGAFSMLGPMDTPSYTYGQEGFAGNNEIFDSRENAAPSAEAENDENRVTLLQLLDGSQYGLTSYRVVGHQLRYTTTYGGRNSVPLERIDFAQTLKLNADRHVKFVLEPAPPTQ